MTDHDDTRRDIARDEARWQHEIKRRHRLRGNTFIPDPAAAPIGTDQEAGGAITTPSGQRKYDNFGVPPDGKGGMR